MSDDNTDDNTTDSKPDSQTVDQELEQIKAKAQEAILDAYHDRDRDTMKRLGWIVEIINLVQQQQAEKDQK